VGAGIIAAFARFPPEPTLKRLLLVACACAAFSGPTGAARPPERQLVAILASGHDPLYLDAASVRRNGARVSFKYLLDVPAPPDEGQEPTAWRSNEVEAVIDCSRRTVEVHRLVTYSGPRGTGAVTAVHGFRAPNREPEPITPKSTFAWLEAHVCKG